MPLRGNRIADDKAVAELRDDFHTTHEEIFAIADNKSEVEVVGWRANVRCRLSDGIEWKVQEAASGVDVPDSRKAYFSDVGLVDTKVLRFEDMERGATVEGPAIIESSFTTVVVDPGASAERRTSGSLVINPASEG
ncbi:MAG: hypothetical protein HN333_07270 [Rhodospirillaceae bacterium]|nr:hypothetical protein [Rhodospirillaceae bacterium]